MSFGRRSSNQSYSPNQSALDFLSPSTRSQVIKTQNSMAKLAGEIVKTPTVENKRVESYQKTLFDKLRKAIDETSNLRLAETESNLAQRFGGSLNSTFGNDLLGRIEKERLNAVENAKMDATLAGNQFAEDLNVSRINKLKALQGYFSNLSSTARDTSYIKEMLARQANQDKSIRRNKFMDIVSKATGFIFPFFR